MKDVEVLNNGMLKVDFLQIDCYTEVFFMGLEDWIEAEKNEKSDLAGVKIVRHEVKHDGEVNEYGHELEIRVLISRQYYRTTRDIVWILERVIEDIRKNKLSINDLKKRNSTAEIDMDETSI